MSHLRNLTAVIALLVVTSLAVQVRGSAAPRAPHVQGPIQHIIFIVKENHTFDDYFGAFPGANGANGVGYARINGITKVIPLNAAPDAPANYSHLWKAAHTAWDNGTMDAFNLADPSCGTPPYPCYQQATQSTIPNYWAYSQQFVLNDNTFSSLMGPSFPNHQYTVAAGSGPDIPRSAIGIPNANLWGCTAPTKTTVPLYDGERVYPCFTYTNLADEMTMAGISWKYYVPAGYAPGTFGQDALIASQADYLLPQANVSDSQFLTDAKNNTLPAFSWMVPPPVDSEHPPNSTCKGENWTVQVLNALMTSPAWSNSVVFLTWDDYGGFYDHMPPKQLDPLGLGFRVPMLIISPFAYAANDPANPHIGHDPLEFASVLRLAEEVFNIPSLGRRDVVAGDPMTELDTSIVHNAPLVLKQRTCPADPFPVNGDD